MPIHVVLEHIGYGRSVMPCHMSYVLWCLAYISCAIMVLAVIVNDLYIVKYDQRTY